MELMPTRRNINVIITSKYVATGFWRNDYVVIASGVRWAYKASHIMLWPGTDGETIVLDLLLL